MRFDQTEAKNHGRWIEQVKSLVVKKASGEVLDVIPHQIDLTLTDRLLLISIGAEIRQGVKIKGKWEFVNEDDYVLTYGDVFTRNGYEQPFFVMTKEDYRSKYYDTKLGDIFNHVMNIKPLGE